MKILAIDDQNLILMSIQKRFSQLGYEVFTAQSGSEGIKLFEKEDPNLVIVDINMEGMSGLEVVKYLRNEKESNVPILVLSGNQEEEIIMDGFELGINDYMKKPVSLREVTARVKRIFNNQPHPASLNLEVDEVTMLQKNCIGVVVPCYNEAERLLGGEFADFGKYNTGYHICFVNDGSTDNTLELLEDLQRKNKDIISVLNLKKNGGKAEAVRQGILHLAKDLELDYLGFLDADLSTNFEDFKDLVDTIQHSNYKIVSGSRIDRMGANISKESSRALISLTINAIIQAILGMKFKDTQCGAKVMDREVATNMFKTVFITRWLFDVEIFMRMKLFYGADRAKKMICEQPLKRWEHMDGSKLSMKDSIKIVGQLAKIATHYRS
ncbi:response regulator [Saccharicrinis aurantiacus]|uniref:response regulator n=1 Tax=Saccharicrinis aurantiacus TaxID=1849719 RepID=UPI00248FDE42|nr:response regulator [Saccharicrinis aurantiacus]